MHTQLLQDKYQEISDFLDKDLCSLKIAQSSHKKESIQSICKASQSLIGVTGLNSFMLVQKEHMTEVTKIFYSTTTQSTIDRSYYTLLATPYWAFLDPTFIRIRYIHFLAFDSFTAKLSEVILPR